MAGERLKQDMPASLSEATVANLKLSFDSYGHYPSLGHWEALTEIARRMESMADGTAAPMCHLSSLDPGIGKTQTVIHFTKALLSSPAYPNVAVLICVGRLAEIGSYVREMGLSDEGFAVLVADTLDNVRLNRMGNPDKDRARVLFTTQQMLESRMKRKGSFEAASEFWFNGFPRQIRLWDEACLPARPLTIDVTKIEGLTASARRNPRFLSLLDRLIADIKNCESGECVSIPDFEIEGGIPLSSALSLYVDDKQSVTDIVHDIYLLRGNTVSVTRDGHNRVMVHYENTLPDDLKPFMVFDASGRVRGVYPHWGQNRHDLVEMTRVSKSYKNMTIHLWPRSGSKHAWGDRDAAREMVRAIVDVINSKPDEPFLIIHHLVKKGRIDLPELVKRIATDPARLNFTYWNSEDCKATNQFRDIPNIILAGTLFFEQPEYEALGKLSRGMGPGERLSKEHKREIELGEHAHLLLQAVCRGTPRKIENGNQAGKADVWLIAAKKSGIPSILNDVFPSVKVVPWTPTDQTPDKIGAATAALTEWAQGMREEMTTTELRLQVGETDANNFRNRVLYDPRFRGALDHLKLELVTGRGRGGSRIIRKAQRLLPPLN